MDAPPSARLALWIRLCCAAAVVATGCIIILSGAGGASFGSSVDDTLFVIALLGAPMAVYLLLVRTLLGSVVIGVLVGMVCVDPVLVFNGDPEQALTLLYAPFLGVPGALLLGICDRILSFVWRNGHPGPQAP